MLTFNTIISLPERGSSLLSFNLSKCTGSGTGCTSLTDFQNVVWYRFPIIVPNLEYGVITHIKLEVNNTNGKCPTGTTINIPISNIPTPTPTVTPTLTITPTLTPTITPTLTPTLTPTITPTSEEVITPTPTITPTLTPTLTITPTLTPTAEPLPGCGDTLTGTYIPTGFTIQTQELDLSEADDESTISVGYVAYDRPNRFNIYGNGMLIENSGWVGADNTYSGPWGTAGSLTDPDGTGSFTFTYQSGMSYELRVDVGPANPLADPAYPSDGWSVTFTCLGMPTPTPTLTPTLTPTPPLNRFYVASPVMDIDETYCVTPGYVLTGALWSYATTISGLMSETVYLDEYGDDVFIGVEGYKYAVSLTSGINTFTNGSSYYELIQIYENGTVWNVLSPNCGSSGGGGDVPQ